MSNCDFSTRQYIPTNLLYVNTNNESMCLLLKNQEKRVSNSALRNENDMLQNENNLINEALKSTICSTCGGPPFPQKEHELFMKKMGEENDQLKQEVSIIASLIIFISISIVYIYILSLIKYVFD